MNEFFKKMKKPTLKSRDNRDIEFPSSGPLYLQLKRSILGGLGVFALKDFKYNETIEISRKLLIPANQIVEKQVLYDYIHDEGNSWISLNLGYAELINHSSIPNAQVEGLAKDLSLVKAIKSIKTGEEILIDYGSQWFSGRGLVAKKYEKFF